MNSEIKQLISFEFDTETKGIIRDCSFEKNGRNGSFFYRFILVEVRKCLYIVKYYIVNFGIKGNASVKIENSSFVYSYANHNTLKSAILCHEWSKLHLVNCSMKIGGPIKNMSQYYILLDLSVFKY